MLDKATGRSHKILAVNTVAFTVCFAAWMLNGVLVSFLASNQVFKWGPVESGWLMGIPVLAGAVFRLPAGVLTDRFGGKPVFAGLLFLCSVPMYLLSYANSFATFALCSFGFGLCGVSFSIGIAYTSVWYPRKYQGTALGIFGAGNAGAAATTLFAPTLLRHLTAGATQLEGWRSLPRYYAAMLVLTGVLFVLLTNNRKPASHAKRIADMLQPLRHMRVWRFGLYYFLVFGCFVAFSQWLVPYFVNVYEMPLVRAGLLAALFSFPSGVIRALGGWLSDRWGARRVMYWVLAASCLISAALVVPKMDIFSPGRGVIAWSDGVVSSVSKKRIVVNSTVYVVKPRVGDATRLGKSDDEPLILPTKDTWQVPVVKVGQRVKKRQLLARGKTRIHFQANVWVFAVLAIMLGAIWGVGKAGVYKYIPDYFPEQVGVVGGTVGVLGGLGGFFCPVIFGYLLEGTGLWTSCWMFMFGLSLACLWWLHRVVRRMTARLAPLTSRHIEDRGSLEAALDKLRVKEADNPQERD